MRGALPRASFAMAEEQGFVKMAQDRKLRVVEVMPPAG